MLARQAPAARQAQSRTTTVSSVRPKRPDRVGGLRVQRPALAPQHRRHTVPCAAQKQQFSSFDAMLAGSSTPVLVDFAATWCGPCLMQSKTLNELAPSMKGKVQFVKIDVDKYPQLASRFQVQALPTLVLFRDGRAVDRIEGVLSAADLRQRLQRFL